MKHISRAAALALLLLCAPAADAEEPAAAPAPAAPPADAAPAPEAQPAWMIYKTPYVNADSDLANPHRTTDEIAQWAQQAAGDVLSFSRDNYRERLSGFKKYFVPAGWQYYAAYLKDTKLLSMVVDDGYAVGAVVSDQPEIIRQGASTGVYHWIVKLPVTISFFHVDESGETKTGPTGQYILFMDIGRAAESGNDDGLGISNWHVEDAPPPQ